MYNDLRGEVIQYEKGDCGFIGGCYGGIVRGGTVFTSDDMYYPMLYYKNVVYLPVLHRQSMEALGLEYKYELGDPDNNSPGCMSFTKT